MMAHEILAIKTPEKLIGRDQSYWKTKFRDLMMAWHPDHCKDPKANEVFIHIRSLCDMAEAKIAHGMWGLTITKKFAIGFETAGRERIHFAITENNKALYENGIDFMQRLSKANYKKRLGEFKEFLPVQILTDEDNLRVTVMKDPAYVPLREVVDKLGGKLEPRHVAWIMNRLYSIACFLHLENISHQDISLDTVYISPEKHQAALLGGWWYACTFDARVSRIPQRTFNLLPWEVTRKKIASEKTDLDLIRAVGREMLGDGDAPAPIKQWLKEVSTQDAFEEYTKWELVLEKSFGKRKFVPMEIDIEEIY